MNEENQQNAQNNIDNNLFADKDQLIAYFQDLTSIDDVGQCLALLESANWNLDEAVQSYFAQNEILHEDIKMNEPHASNEDSSIIINEPCITNVRRSNHINPSIISSFQDIAYPNFLNDPRRYLEFEIEFKNFKKNLRVADTETIGFLKRLCETEFSIPYEKQILKGWKDRDLTLLNNNVDQIKLRELHLPLKTTLYLLKKNNKEDDDNDVIENEASSRTSKSPSKIHSFELCTYDIFIHLSSNSLKNFEKMATTSSNIDNKNSFKLKYESNNLFSKLKHDILKLSKISLKNQEWYWKMPDELNIEMTDETFISDNLILIPNSFDNSCLYDLKQYLYNLYVEKFNNCNKNKANNIFKLEFYVRESQQKSDKKFQEQCVEEIIVDDDDNINHNTSYHDNDEDDDISFQLQPVNEVNTSKRRTLISDDYKSEEEAIGQFNKAFSERYGSIIPLFFVGSLEDAIKESLLLPVNDRKLLAIYLHSDKTIYCNIFCQNTLCNEEIINYLSLNFVLWPWDLTSAKNEDYFYSLCLKYLGGSVVITTIKQFKNKLPALILLTRVRSNNEIIAVMEGDSTKETLLMSLMQSDEIFQQQRSKDAIEEKQREDRERIKREQDAAYQASLDYDKAKRQKQEDELHKELKSKQEQEQLKLKLQKEFNDKKIQYSNNLRSEPELTNENSKQLTTIRIKELDGKIIQRRFNIEDPLEQVIYYLGSLGYFEDKFKLLTTWPRRDLAFELKEKSLKDLKLYPQETIILEERDE